MIIYKYLDEKGAIETIKNNSVLLRTPLEYNDPFDSIFSIDENELDKAFKLYVNYQLFLSAYKSLFIEGKNPSTIGKITKKNMALDIPVIKKNLVYKSRPYITLSYKAGMKAYKKDDTIYKKRFKKQMKESISALRNIALVSCFGSSFDSVLMWSHYANKHKGVCLEFEIDDLDFKKVTYSDMLPSFKLTESLEVLYGHEFSGKEVDTNNPEYRFMLEPLFVKSNVWSYEGEVRCVYSKSNLDPKIYKINDEGGEKILLKMPKIKKIYLGCNTSEKFDKKINELSKDIPVYKMKMNITKYSLEAERKQD